MAHRLKKRLENLPGSKPQKEVLVFFEDENESKEKRDARIEQEQAKYPKGTDFVIVRFPKRTMKPPRIG